MHSFLLFVSKLLTGRVGKKNSTTQESGSLSPLSEGVLVPSFVSQSFVNFLLTSPRLFPSQGDFTWSSLSGRSVRLTPVAVQSLSELERARLQEVAYTRLLQDYDLGCQITIPKGRSKACIFLFLDMIYKV